ncbi:MAG: CinA family protein, partial [Gammaproteobacteria bacterium]
AGKPAGTVCFAWARGAARATRSERAHFDGSRAQVRAQSISHALAGLLALFEGEAAESPIMARPFPGAGA